MNPDGPGGSGPSPACISQPLSVTRETGAWPQGASFLGNAQQVAWLVHPSR